MEEWRPCKESRIYEASSNGQIRNRRTGRILKTQITSHGYETVQLNYDGDAHTHRVHRLVANAFYDEYDEKLDVNHIDGNKLNNNIENLEICTRQNNIRHAFRTGLKNSNHRKCQVRVIETDEIFDSITECANYLGVDKSSVACCLRGKSKTCKRYHLEKV